MARQLHEEVILLSRKYLETTFEDSFPFDEFRRAILKEVSFLLNNDFEKLIRIFYRIDITKKKKKKVIHFSDLNDLTSDLTDLIINRLILKAKTRIQYAQDNL